MACSLAYVVSGSGEPVRSDSGSGPESAVTSRQAMLFVAVLVVLGVVAGALGGFRWAEFVAVTGTAAGTLGLAFYTYDLARATRRAEAQSEALVRVGQDQARASQRQLKISAAEAAAAERTGTKAARARIDAAAPLLGLTVTLGPVLLPGMVGPVFGDLRLLGDEIWPRSDLADVRVMAPVQFRLVNYGRSPALVSFPRLLPDPKSLLVRTGGSRSLVLAPGESYGDVQEYHLNGLQAVGGVKCEIVVTCNSINHGATSTRSGGAGRFSHSGLRTALLVATTRSLERSAGPVCP